MTQAGPESRTWYPGVLATALDAIITTDAMGEVVQFNEAAERLFGYSSDEACGQGIAELIIPPEHQAAYWAGMLKIVTGQEEQLSLDEGLEMVAWRKDGSRIPVMFSATRTLEPPLRLRGFFRDLSAQRDAEIEIGRNERRVVKTEELLGHGTLELDLATSEMLWSDGLSRVLGQQPGTIASTAENFLAMVHPENRVAMEAIFTRLRDDPASLAEEGVTATCRLISASGEFRVTRCFGRFENDESGGPGRWVMTIQDITEFDDVRHSLSAHEAVTLALYDWEQFDGGPALLLKRLGSSLGCPIGSFWTRSEGEGPLVCRAFWCAPHLAGEELEKTTRRTVFSPGQGAPGRVWVAGAPILTEEIRSEGRSRQNDIAIKLGLKSAIAFPAMGEDGPLAALCFFSDERVSASGQLQRTLTSIGRELGRFLERRQADFGTRSISPREREILELAAEGNNGPSIAGALQVSPSTVKTHFESIYEKLGVNDRAAAVARGIRSGLIR